MNIVTNDSRSTTFEIATALRDCCIAGAEKVSGCVWFVLEKAWDAAKGIDNYTFKLIPSAKTFGASVKAIAESIRRKEGYDRKDGYEGVLAAVQFSRGIVSVGGILAAPLVNLETGLGPSVAFFVYAFLGLNLVLEGAAAWDSRKIQAREAGEEVDERTLNRIFNEKFLEDLQQLCFRGGRQVQRELKRFFRNQEISSYALSAMYAAFGAALAVTGDPRIALLATVLNLGGKFLRYSFLSRQLRGIQEFHQNQQIESNLERGGGEIDFRFLDPTVPSPSPVIHSSSSSSLRSGSPNPSPSPPPNPEPLPSPFMPIRDRAPSARSLPVVQEVSMSLEQVARFYRFLDQMK